MEAAKRALALDPDFAFGYFALASIYNLKKDPDPRAAERHLRLARELDPSVPYYHGGLGWTLAQQGKHREAIQLYQEAIALSPELCSLHRNLAWLLTLQGRYSEAEKQFTEAAKDQPHLASKGLAVLEWLQGNRGEAVRKSESPLTDVDYRDRGLYLESLRDLQGAIRSHAKALELQAHAGRDPEHRFWHEGTRPGARDELARLLRSLPSPARLDGLDVLVQVLEKTFDRTRRDPRLVGVLALARAHGPKDADRALALQAASEAAALSRRQDADVLATLAVVQLAAGGREDALEALEDAVRLPGATQEHRSLLEEHRRAMTASQLSYASIDAALAGGEDLESALAANRRLLTDPRLSYLLGCLLEGRGDVEEAADRFAEVARADPGALEPHLRLAECLAAAGDAEGAERHLRAALATRSLSAREAWERWGVLSLRDLRLAPAEVLARFPAAGDRLPYAADLRWLLERLAAGEPVRIDCGADSDRALDGKGWSRDRFFTGGRARGPLERGLERVHETERLFAATELHRGYRIPLPARSYTLTLRFVENWFDSPGQRRFDVVVEGERVLVSYEPHRRGYAVPDACSGPVTVRDALLEIELVPVSEEATISAIEIHPLD